MEVGPSAAPIIPMEAASFISNAPVEAARNMAINIPNWAAAPKNSITGCFNRGLKSIMAPTAINISIGNNSVEIPASFSKVKNPPSPTADDRGMLANKAPNPIGNSSIGSYFFFIAK